jgi:4-amino-4-deoxy-L-arabinose transferase-like glycosyltransferase
MPPPTHTHAHGNGKHDGTSVQRAEVRTIGGIDPWRLGRLLVLAAVVVRLAFCFVVYPKFFAGWTTIGTQYFLDSYREIAVSLVTSGEYRIGPGGPFALHRPPGYTLVLAAAAPTTTAAKALFQIYNAILGGLATLATIRLARDMNLGSARSLAAGAIVSFWPFLVWQAKVTTPENLLLALLPLFAIALRRASVGQSASWAAAAGTLAAAATLTHAQYLGLLFAGVLALLGAGIRRRRPRMIGVFAVVFALTVGAWVERNARHGYVGIATGFGFHYWKGVYSFEILRTDPVSYFRDHDADSTQWLRSIPGLAGIPLINAVRSDPYWNRVLDRLALDDAWNRPTDTLAKVAVKTPLAWVQQQTPLRSLFNALLVLPLLAFALRGARSGRDVIVLWMPVVLLNLAAALVFVEAIPMRYALPWIPLTAILAAKGWPSGTQRRLKTVR